MPTIWKKEDRKWRPMAPSGYPNEEKLHDLVEEGPSVLPLSGSPRLTVIGREVMLGTGSADLLAVEDDGRPVVIEVKLRTNPESRRAVIAQVLSYAAALYGMRISELEEKCSKYLGKRGFADIGEGGGQESQTGAFDPEAFRSGLSSYLASGEFRVVVVLDDAPADLVILARYLSDMGERLLVDVLTVHQFIIGTDQDEAILVPERVDLDRPPPVPVRSSKTASRGELLPGPDAFITAAADSPSRDRMLHLAEWAKDLAAEGLVTLHSYVGGTSVTLLPRLKDEGVGLATVWTGGTNLQIWRSVIERRALEVLPEIERLAAPKPVSQGTAVQATEEMLSALRKGYEIAAGVQRP